MVSKLSRDIPGTYLYPRPKRPKQTKELGRNENSRIRKIRSPSPRNHVADTGIDPDPDQTDVSLINGADYMFMDHTMPLYADAIQEQYTEFLQVHANSTEIENPNLPFFDWRKSAVPTNLCGSETITDSGGIQAGSWAIDAIKIAQPGLSDQGQTSSSFVRWNTPERQPSAETLLSQHAQSGLCPPPNELSFYFDEDEDEPVISDPCIHTGSLSRRGQSDSVDSQPTHETFVLHKSLSSFELYLFNHCKFMHTSRSPTDNAETVCSS